MCRDISSEKRTISARDLEAKAGVFDGTNFNDILAPSLAAPDFSICVGKQPSLPVRSKS